MATLSKPTYTASEARSRFSELLDEAAEGEVFIARHGKPVAALMGVDHYEELLSTLEALEEELLAERAQASLARIAAGEESTMSFAEVFGEPQ